MLFNSSFEATIRTTLLKPNILLAGLVGLVLGLLAAVISVLADRVPLLGCVVAPIAFVVGLAIPILVGALAAAWSRGQGWASAPSGILDGAIAAGLAELVSRLIAFVASVSAQFLGTPRSLVPSVELPVRAILASMWGIGWVFVSLVVAVLLGALGGFLYNAAARR